MIYRNDINKKNKNKSKLFMINFFYLIPKYCKVLLLTLLPPPPPPWFPSKITLFIGVKGKISARVTENFVTSLTPPPLTGRSVNRLFLIDAIP